ncbi:MAG: hypothetical protein M3O06_02935 [Pseudomonadota bacterium]|nr:hypothetical protein [Pseudomonadota bacterium]
MKHMIHSSAIWLAAGLQRLGAGIDFEILALPGGSVIALFLWMYAGAAGGLKLVSPRLVLIYRRLCAIHCRAFALRLLPSARCAGCDCA